MRDAADQEARQAVLLTVVAGAVAMISVLMFLGPV